MLSQKEILSIDLVGCFLKSTRIFVTNITRANHGASFPQLLNNLNSNECVTEELRIEDTAFTDNQVKLLAYAICANTSLRKLELKKCPLDDKQAGYIASALTYNSTITDLSLSDNKIGNLGAVKIAKMLRSNKAIEYFSFSSNLVSDYGLEQLENAIQSSVSLHSISILHNYHFSCLRNIKEKFSNILSPNQYILDYNVYSHNIQPINQCEVDRKNLARTYLKDFEATETKDILKRDFNVYYFWYIHYYIQNSFTKPQEEVITKFHNIIDTMFNCGMKFKFKLLSIIQVSYLNRDIWNNTHKYFTFAEKLVEIGQYYKMYNEPLRESTGGRTD